MAFSFSKTILDIFQLTNLNIVKIEGLPLIDLGKEIITYDKIISIQIEFDF